MPARGAADFIKNIAEAYGGEISLRAPYRGARSEDIPEELYSILEISDGISETAQNPCTGEKMTVAWILYPHAQILEESRFFKNEYGVDGTAFTDDGAGNPYLLKAGGTVVFFDAIDGEEIHKAASLYEFYTK